LSRDVLVLLTYRPAQAADVPAIVALVERAYRGAPSRAGWTTEADLLDGQRTDDTEVQGLVAGARTRLVLALHAPSIVGSVLLRAPEGEGAAYVGMFAVEPTLQDQGIGRGLLAEVERIVRAERMAPRLRMTVISQRRELIAWYVRRGYTLTGERDAFPYGQPRFGIPRRDDLMFEVLEKSL
jgi:ribosomal protein S18 acetylase RimI-like enzyme